MSVSVEKKEKNMAVLTIEVSAEKFAEAIEKVYQRQKNSITLPGFRKGKAPRKMIEKMYGKASMWKTIQEANNLPDNAVLKLGQRLVIPPKQ